MIKKKGAQEGKMTHPQVVCFSQRCNGMDTIFFFDTTINFPCPVSSKILSSLTGSLLSSTWISSITTLSMFPSIPLLIALITLPSAEIIDKSRKFEVLQYICFNLMWGQNFLISWFTNPPTVIFRKGKKKKSSKIIFFILCATSKYYLFPWKK